MYYSDKMKYVEKMFGNRINEKNEKYFYLYWEKVDIKDNIDDCWNWLAYIHYSGYGYFHNYRLSKSAMPAHRVAYMLSKGSIPGRLQIQHLCNNRLCCNPNHLELGDDKKNMRYMVECNRQNINHKGENNPSSKLKEDDVREIHTLYKEGFIQQDIAEMFEVTQVCVSSILTGKNWHHIYEEFNQNNVDQI